MKMKKTLALILALLMMLSVALVSCSDKPEETEDPTDDFWGDVNDPAGTDESDETGDGNETDNSGNNTTSSNFVTKNDTVYVCFKAAVRSEAKTTSDLVATLDFGTHLQRIEANRKWSKIKYGEVEGYIANDLITTNSGSVKFTTLETPVTSKVSKLGNSSNANLREYPLALSAPSVIDLKAFNAASIKGQIAKDTEVTIISVSGDGQWAYIKCMAKAKADKGEFATTATEMEGYCSTSVLDYNFGNNSGNNNSGVLG